MQELDDFREHAQTLSPPQIDYGKFRKTVRTYKKNTLGSDCWGRNELEHLPPQMSQNIVDSLSLRLVAVLHQSLMNLNTCLGKSSGGVRTVTKTPMLYRM